MDSELNPSDIILTPAVAGEVLRVAREVCEAKRRPFEPETAEIVGIDGGEIVFRVAGMRVSRRVEKSEMGGLFGGEETVHEDRTPDTVFVWSHDLPVWCAQSLLAPPIAEMPEGPRLFGKRTREVSHA